ncbi:MAG: aconitate hydratase [Desulfomonilia bacterium]|jgi:aconitate hydratase|uniref:Aconitate hydratase n=1 Tax=anaerobic digester metagenome TaxID=1263854 RepID=A0A485M2C0_9ZZZZ|nr:aconitate hydratase [Pseudomonadota bacterium]HON38259.1 aconitate hydratase [Deltaproteobacteria bacterium]HPD22209.1 aconitate hydratase [Deltaproteobacteria bacterium]HRS57017.1 aconitate hydratase [Desulfomonilia bacterium]HRV36620.1 aconitate hydratase [Desulfomonilia bacterium]
MEKKTLARKIIDEHIIGENEKEYALKIDQTLTQDATGTMAYLEFEAIGLDRVKTELSVSYVDHNTLQSGFENADDHRFLQDIARKYGIYFSRPGNGICHQVHLERFGVPGKTLLGSDSHTPTAGGIGMLAIGAGGLDVASAMAGMPFSIPKPKVVGVVLTGRLNPWVSAKDVILEVLRRVTVKGGVGRIFEYTGSGVSTLSVPERATITNMGAELGATTSIFPSDEVTRAFLAAQGRGDAWRPLAADEGAVYDETIEIDLSGIEPLAACPHSPDKVVPVRELAGKKVDQVLIGSCTNSSLKDLMMVAAVLKGRKIHPETSFAIAPGSRQVLAMLAGNGALADIIGAGARILENACGPCIGMGQAPKTGGVSVRTFNRNFPGRSGTASAGVYLVSPEVAVACTLTGCFTDPRDLGAYPDITLPEKFLVDDSMIIPPSEEGETVQISRGPNIRPLPRRGPMEDRIEMEVLLKLEDNITTDDIMPAGAKILPLRSNIEAISSYVFSGIDPDFSSRARQAGAGCVLARENYGQGSSREHAALAPMYLGVKAVLARSFARIHRSNLINFGILPVIVGQDTYEGLKQGSRIVISGITAALEGSGALTIHDPASGKRLEGSIQVSARERDILKEGGLLNYIKSQVQR